MFWSRFSLLVAGLLVRLCAAQESGWLPNQVNTTMCYWDSPRAAVIRDTLYIDGGYLWWQTGMADGSAGTLVQDGNPLGLVYLLNFGTPFSTSDNISNVFTTVSKASGGGNANNIGPLYYDGGMFANDYEWFTYGGLLTETDAFDPPDADSVASYAAFPARNQGQFKKGYTLDKLPNGITRYVTNGAAVSVPSENLGFYFGGLRSANWSSIFYSPGPNNDSSRADTESLTLIELDMTVQQKETWNNYTLPTEVPGRANAELVWVPVSEQGILVAIGGVIYPSFANINQTNNLTATADSKRISPTFMSTVAVYDIAKKVWYEQETSGSGPGQLTQGCTVLASAQDGSSHNIYWYGGFDGLDPSGTFNDDVWILSIPTFMWMKVKSGTASHGRAGHKCTKPYPNQMMVIGGYASLPASAPPKCLDGGIIQIFNLSSGEWIDSYDPKVWSNYTVPSIVYQMIGGSSTGSATQSVPSPSGFANQSMTALFGSAYNASKITTWYPYAATETNNNNRTTLLPTPVAGKSGTPSYLAPVLGVVLGLFFITLIVLAVLLYRRRKLLRMSGTATQSEAGTMDNRRWVTSWLRSTPADAKAPTVTTDETPMSSYEEEPHSSLPHNVPEMGGGQVYEMDDTSRAVELHGTGFVPVTILNGDRKGLSASPSVTSHASHTSTVSRVSQTSGRPGISPTSSPRADSPPLGDVEGQRIVSDLSISDTDRGHLRGISETSVSTNRAYATPMEGAGLGLSGATAAAPEQARRPTVVSPLTPPQGTQESGDYMGAGSQAGSPSGGRRRSNFQEGLDELEKK